VTDYGSRAERWVATRWPAIRARGMWHFVLLKGVAFWGGLMFAFMTVLMLLQLGPAHPRLPLVLAVAVPLCAFGGLCWGLLTWIFNERIHRAITDKNEIA
jgi:multisubunit Na+/H+ antiporter MnhB subunit